MRTQDRATRQCRKPARSIRALLLSLTVGALIVGLGWAPASADDGVRAESQLKFGIQMAKRGLWNEALFRFSRVLQQRPGDVRVLNNIAVAYEAIGEFDTALEYYRRALEGDSANRELRRNYAQFVEFYESLRPKTEDEPEAGSELQAEPESPRSSEPEGSLEPADSEAGSDDGGAPSGGSSP